MAHRFPQRLRASVALVLVVAAAFLCHASPSFAQAKRIPTRLIYVIDERPTGQMFTFSTGDAGCVFQYARSLAKTVAASNWTRTWTESCGTFTHTQRVFKTGAAYWTYGTDQTKPNGCVGAFSQVKQVTRVQ